MPPASTTNRLHFVLPFYLHNLISCWLHWALGWATIKHRQWSSAFNFTGRMFVCLLLVFRWDIEYLTRKWLSECDLDVENIRYTILSSTKCLSLAMPILWFLFLLFLQLDESRPPNASLNNDNNSQVPVTENVNGKSGKIEYQQTNIVWPRARALQQKREGRKIKTQNHYRKFTIPHNAVVNKPFIVSTLSRQSATRDVQSSGKSVHTWWLHIHHTTA